MPDSTPEIACCGGWGGVWIPASGLGGPGDPGVKVFRTPPWAVGGDAVSLVLILTRFLFPFLPPVSHTCGLSLSPPCSAPPLCCLAPLLGVGFLCVWVSASCSCPCAVVNIFCVSVFSSVCPLFGFVVCLRSSSCLSGPPSISLCVSICHPPASPPHFLPLLDPHRLPLSPGTHSLGLPPTSGA